MVKTIFELCKPRQDVLKGIISDGDFAADLSQVIRGVTGGEALKNILTHVSFLKRHTQRVGYVPY